MVQWSGPHIWKEAGLGVNPKPCDSGQGPRFLGAAFLDIYLKSCRVKRDTSHEALGWSHTQQTLHNCCQLLVAMTQTKQVTLVA